MGLRVYVNPDKPSIEVKGQVIKPMRRDQLSDLLRGENDLVERIEKRHKGRHRIDDFHLSDKDQMPRNLAGTFAKYKWKPVLSITQSQRRTNRIGHECSGDCRALACCE